MYSVLQQYEIFSLPVAEIEKSLKAVNSIYILITLNMEKKINKRMEKLADFRKTKKKNLVLE